MTVTNSLITFLRHYGPIPAGDNMYDELIQIEIDRHNIEPPIHIPPARLSQICENFEKSDPSNIILTGTAGDGKTYHCRRIWEHFGGDHEKWQCGEKIVFLPLPASTKTLIIVKDLSELTLPEKESLLPDLALAISGQNEKSVFFVAANDGQLLATWHDWSEPHGGNTYRDFKTLEGMLVEERSNDNSLDLHLYNLSQLDPSKHFHELIEQVLEHPKWAQCQGCKLLKDDGTTTCPIRINRERLRGGPDGTPFRHRLGELLRA